MVVVVRTTVPAGDADHVTVEVVAAKDGVNTEVVAPLRCERTPAGWVLVEHDGRRRPPLPRDRALAALQATALRWAAEFLGWDWGGGDEWESI